MSLILPPIPPDPIGENIPWRNWFFRVKKAFEDPFLSIQHNLLGGIQGGTVPTDVQHLTTPQVNRMKSNQVLTWLSM